MAAGAVVGIWPHAITKEIAELLQPAADLAGEQIDTGPGWTVWTVHRDGGLIGAANVRRTVDRAVEVVLVGGRDSKDWIGRLDELIGEWARDEGAIVLRAYGRVGWVRVLTRQGWKATERDRVTEYERAL